MDKRFGAAIGPHWVRIAPPQVKQSWANYLLSLNFLIYKQADISSCFTGHLSKALYPLFIIGIKLLKQDPRTAWYKVGNFKKGQFLIPSQPFFQIVILVY